MSGAPIAPLQHMFWCACERLLLRHTNPWELDEALTAWGYGLGPCEAQDLIGLDAVLADRRGLTCTPILGRMVAEGRLGKKCGWGYYRYPGGGGAVIDPLIEDLIHEEVRFANDVREELEAGAIVAVLHAGIAADLRADRERAVALLHFPRHRLDEL